MSPAPGLTGNLIQLNLENIPPFFFLLFHRGKDLEDSSNLNLGPGNQQELHTDKIKKGDRNLYHHPFTKTETLQTKKVSIYFFYLSFFL